MPYPKDAELSSVRLAEQSPAPDTPASGYGQLYAKSDGLYFKDDGGVEVGPLAAAGGGGSIGSLTSWTPTITQSGGVAVTVDYAQYCVMGPLYYICGQLSVTGTGTGDNDITISNLPALPAANGVYGHAYINDSGTGFYVGAMMYFSSNFQIRGHLEGDDVGKEPNFALANGDTINFFALYPNA